MTATPSNSRTVGLDPSAGGMSLPRLLFALLRQRFTGTLELEQPGSWGPGSGVRTVWLRGGMPVFTDWASEADYLGDILLAKGAIDPPTLERGLRALAGGGRLGDILLGFGAIDAAQRTDALRVQCTRKLLHLFALRGGEVVVRAGEHDLGQGDELAAVNVLGLILRGVVGHFDRARIEAEMAGALAADMVATPALPKYQRQFGFVDEDARVLGALARGVTLASLIKPGVDATRALQIIYVLWACQMLRCGQDALEAIAKGATAASSPEPAPAAAPAPASKPAAPASKPAAASKPEPPPPPKPEAKPEAKPEPVIASKPEPATDTFDFDGALAMLELKVAAEANAFELFGLTHEADRKQIREVWAELSKRFHPDALESSGRAALRGRVEPVFAALSEAYGVLSDKDAREKLREAILAGGSKVKATDDASIVVRNAIEAEMIARDADKLLRGNSWERARDLYARAHELSPSDPDIEAALIYARHMAQRANNASMADSRDALTGLAQVIQIAPGCSRAAYFAGMIHLQLDEGEAAKLRFMDALRADPRNVDAERQLRGLKIKERASGTAPPDPKKPGDDKKLGGLRGIFGGGKKL